MVCDICASIVQRNNDLLFIVRMSRSEFSSLLLIDNFWLNVALFRKPWDQIKIRKKQKWEGLIMEKRKKKKTNRKSLMHLQNLKENSRCSWAGDWLQPGKRDRISQCDKKNNLQGWTRSIRRFISLRDILTYPSGHKKNEEMNFFQNHVLQQ